MAFVEGLPGHFFIREDNGTLKIDVCPCEAHRDSQEPTRKILENLGHQLVGSPEFDQWFGVLLNVFEEEAYQRGWDASEEEAEMGRAWASYDETDYCSRCDD